MKKEFSSYFQLPPEEMQKIWKNCLFVFDANVLLDLYRYSPKTRDQLIEILDKLKDRVWVPNQVAKEYLKNRPLVIMDQTSVYKEAKRIVERLNEIAGQEIEKNLNFRVHPFIDKTNLQEEIKNALNVVAKKLDDQKEILPESITDDKLLEKITILFEGKVGAPYESDELKKKFELGKIRYANKIPPGYEDGIGKNKKEGNDIYGDLILWFQTIDKAKESKNPIIFVCNDNKEDWWWKSKRKTIGFRPELREEMQVEAKVEFYMYNSDRFMSYAHDFLDIDVSGESIEEVREVRLHDEMIQGVAKSISSNLARHAIKVLEERYKSNKERTRSIEEEVLEINYEVLADETPPETCLACGGRLIDRGYRVLNGVAGRLIVCNDCGYMHHLLDSDY